MFNFFKKRKIQKTLFKMFPRSLQTDVEIVVKLIPSDSLPPAKVNSFEIGSDHVEIYYRIYNIEPSDFLIHGLTETQRLILSCIYSRSHDGYVREKYLKNILANQKSWTTPFVMMLLGEYVIEIIKLIEDKLNEDKSHELYMKFINNNSVFWSKTKDKIQSYWNVYYRNIYPNINDYPGWRIKKLLDKEYFGVKIQQ